MNNNKISVNIYDELSGDTEESLVIVGQDIPISDTILIGCTPTMTGNAVIDTLVVYAGETSVENMKAYRVESLQQDNRMVISTDFSSGTLGFSRNKITVPNPKPATPIIVEDEEGTIYERVYFLDQGEYTVYNKVKIKNTGRTTFKVEYDDILSARAYSTAREYKDITINGNAITVNDLVLDTYEATDDELIMTGVGIYKASNQNWLKEYPVTVKRVISEGYYDEVDSSEYIVGYDTGTIIFKTAPTGDTFVASYSYTTVPEFTLQYTPRNVFCASYNKENGGYELLLSNVNGKKVIITYENDYGAETKLATTVEANPFKAASNNGFVYIVDKPVEVTTLDVKVTPESVVADGNQVVTISVDCIGDKSTPTSNASLSVTLEHGNKYGRIERYVSKEEQVLLDAIEAFKQTPEYTGDDSIVQRFGYFVTDEHISGRYVYKFYVNNISTGGAFTEKIIITDTKSGVGTEVPIRIVSKS